MQDRAVRAVSGSSYVTDFLQPAGYAFAAAAPLAAPVFEGYAGAIQILRREEQGDFTDADLRRLTEAARRLDGLYSSARASRAADKDGNSDWNPSHSTHQFIFGQDGKIILNAAAFEEIDEHVRYLIDKEVRHRLTHLEDSEDPTSARVLLPDSAGDYVIFNVVSYKNYPALNGSVVFVCAQPSAPEWALIRTSDFLADPEMARLVPALRFMQAEFHRGPTLVEISKTVSLSPFHFHRRFSELFGITPKHFLLECQIHEAKGELLAGEKELAKIASDCGFAHQSHFTSRFKQAVGLTPTRWRRMARGRSANAES
jgi:AraC-like DNA-binding protein